MNKKLLGCLGLVFLTAVGCFGANKIEVMASVPEGIVVDFDDDAANVELIDQETGEASPGEIVTCAAHPSLHGWLNVAVHSANTKGDLYFYVRHGEHFVQYLVGVARSVDVIENPDKYLNKMQPLDEGISAPVPGAAQDEEDFFAIALFMHPDDVAYLQRGVTYQDTLTVEVAYP